MLILVMAEVYEITQTFSKSPLVQVIALQETIT